MEKQKFMIEYELRSSPKVLFPYISTPSGLEQWFAEKVITMPESRFDFQWDGESHFAKQTSVRLNKSVKFEFEGTSDTNDHDNNSIELRLEVSELTQSTYLRILDYSAGNDEQELTFLWNGLIESLKEIVGS